MILYEFPLNERIRTLLRLEDLYDSVRHFLGDGENALRFEHHTGLIGIFEILDVASRADLKSDLLQELERQRVYLLPLKDNPAIEPEMWQRIMADIEGAYANLHKSPGKTGQELRDNEWLMAIKQRSAIPGGVCEFDLPSYHYWMNQPAARRQADILRWMQPLVPVYEALSVVLRVLRESGRSRRFTATSGTFQQMPMERPAQLLRLLLDEHLECVPELSANKYALNIRFLQPGGVQKSRLYEQSVDFELSFCNL